MTLQLPKFAQRLNIPPVPSPIPAPTPSPKIQLVVVNSPAHSTIPPSPQPLPLPSQLPLPSPGPLPLPLPGQVPLPLPSPRPVTLPLPSPRVVTLPVTPTIPMTTKSNVEILTPSRSAVPSSPSNSTGLWVGVPTPRRTQVYTPRVGIKSPTLPGENPWIPEVRKGAGEIKIAGITPIGNIAPVPTADNRPPPTPRTLQRQIQQQTREEADPVMINATIYLDCTKPEDVPYDYVAKRMQSISQTTTNLQKQYANTFQPLPALSGWVTPVQFEQALAIYENNQVYYQDCLDNKTLSKAEISSGLTELEHWFVRIVEPLSLEGSKDREQEKTRSGRSAYCDPELYSYIVPLK